MEYILKLADFSIKLESERSLRIEDAWKPYIRPTDTDANLTVQVSWDWEKAMHPSSKVVGQDAISCFYREGQEYYCVSRHGAKGPVTSVSYQRDLSKMICTVNEKPFLNPPDSVGRIMRALPLREILTQYSTLFIHGAQIAYHGKGIIFSAPSGTGKTTQAKLWKAWKNAEIVCNDRTLVKKTNGKYHTYGYPLDGAEPIINNETFPLGAIILLEQGSGNEVCSLPPIYAVAKMMEQMVMDTWNPVAREKIVHLLLDMIKVVPVYLYSCTPDKEAVEVLYQYLIKNEVIEIG